MRARRHAVGLWVAAVAGVAAAWAAGCGGSTVPVLQNGASELGALDAGTGLCGAAACAAGELCCAGSDLACTATCMNVAACPAYGHACTVDAGSGAGGDGGSAEAGSALAWYTTCGDPVCRPPDGGVMDAGACAAQGTPCSTKGATCGDPNQSCGSVTVCDDHDPKGGPGGCPISTRKYKDDVSYLASGDLQRLHDETLSMRLATYRYKGPFTDPNDPSAKHLGFIVEDQPESMSVDRGHDRVDLYGYISMTVATMQVQEKEIARLEREVEALKSGCGGGKGVLKQP